MSLITHGLPALSSAPDSVVIFLHGLGDSGSGGLLDIGRIWQRDLPNTEFLCPDAPHAFDQAPPDFGGRQWFSLREFTLREMDDGVRSAAPILNNYIDEVLQTRNLPPSRLVLVGFSQGTMMALQVGLRRAAPIAGILGYSGLLADVGHLEVEKKVVPPVMLIHGTADDVVPFAAMNAAAETLGKVGIQTETLACPNLGHSIDENGLVAGLLFIKNCLKN